MNPHQSADVAQVAAPPRRRLKIAAAVIAGIVILGAAGLVGVWYFTPCGNCGGPSPILCGNPCELPTLGALPDATRRPVSA